MSKTLRISIGSMGTEDGQESDVLFLLNKIHWRRKVAIVRMVRTEDGEEEGVHFRGGERAVRVDGREKGRQGRKRPPEGCRE